MSLHFLHLWTIGQKGFLSDFDDMLYGWITSLNVQKLQIFAIFASYLASILKQCIKN